MAVKRTKQPRRSAPGEITEFVMKHPLFGAHSHIMSVPEWGRVKPHFSSIVGYAWADLVTACGPLGIGKKDVLPPVNNKGYTRQYFELWQATRFTGYCTATGRACRDLLGLEYTEQNAKAIGESITRLIGKDPLASYRTVLRDKTNVRWLIKDSICTPEATADELYPADFVRFNYRDDELMSIRSRADIVERETRWGRSIHSVTELVDGLNESISACLATGKVTSFKIGIPYYRSLSFTEPTLHEAEKAFSRLMNVTVGTTVDQGPGHGVQRICRVAAEELRPLQDYMAHQYVRRIEAEGMGLQVHTGFLAGNSGVLNDIRVMDMVPFIIRYPRVRFDLFHAGWPYTEEHAVIGKEFPNVWLNLCWAWAMNPVTMELVLDSWLASVPHTKIFGYGGDTGMPICEYGYAHQARTGIARVLEKWIARGDMTIKEATEVATDIMLLNGCRFHALEA